MVLKGRSGEVRENSYDGFVGDYVGHRGFVSAQSETKIYGGDCDLMSDLEEERHDSGAYEGPYKYTKAYLLDRTGGATWFFNPAIYINGTTTVSTYCGDRAGTTWTGPDEFVAYEDLEWQSVFELPDTNPSPDRLVGSVTYTLTNPPPNDPFDHPNEIWHDYQYKMTYDLTRVYECEASFRVGVTGRAGDTGVSFNPAKSEVPGANPTYTWEFGDGTTEVRTTNEGFIHRYPAPGRYEVRLTVDSDFCAPPEQNNWESTPDTVVADPVTAFAPTVVMHPDEKYWPGSADQFIASSSLQYRPQANRFPDSDIPASCRPRVLAAAGQVAPDRLGMWSSTPYRATRWSMAKFIGGYSCEATTGTMRANGDPEIVTKRSAKSGMSDWDANDGMILNLPNTAAARTGNAPVNGRVDAPMYYEVKWGPNGSGAIIYWFFSPYNGWSGAGGTEGVTENHEGDWERIVVRLGTSSIPDRVAFYQHYCSAEIVYRSDLTADPTGSARTWHPMVWSAKGGHASYPYNVGTVGNEGSCTTDQPFQGIGDMTGNGATWRPWDTASPATWLIAAGRQKWYGFGGSWGDRVPSDFSNYGPAGPGYHRSTIPVWLP